MEVWKNGLHLKSCFSSREDTALCLMFYRIPQNRLDDRQQQQPGARKKYDRNDEIRKDGRLKNKERQEDTEEFTQSQRRLVNRPDRSPRWMDRKKGGGFNINEGCWKTDSKRSAEKRPLA